MTDTPSSDLVKINVKEILSFFDEKPDWSIKHATSVVGVIGEDLNAACFQRYMESNGAKATVLQDPVGTGKRKGPRLDRWIKVDCPHGSRTLFQTEIKNWSAHAIGGETLPVDASHAEVTKYKQKRWKDKWDSRKRTLKNDYIAKVMVPMKPPSDLGLKEENIRPLLIFWEALGPKARSHLFCMTNLTYNFPFNIPSTWPNSMTYEFPELWVFSVSSYLRSIKDAIIELPMPNVASRLQALERLTSVM